MTSFNPKHLIISLLFSLLSVFLIIHNLGTCFLFPVCGFTGGWPIPIIENYPAISPNEFKFTYWVNLDLTAKTMYAPGYQFGNITIYSVVAFMLNTVAWYFLIILFNMSKRFYHRTTHPIKTPPTPTTPPDSSSTPNTSAN